MSASASTSSPRRSSRLAKGASSSRISKNPTTSTSQPHRSPVKKNKPQRKRLPNPESQKLYLRVNQKFLFLLPTATADQPTQPTPPPPGTTGNLNVIIANLPDLRPFAGDNVDWLIKVARLILEPLGTGSLYTFTTESLEWWLDREMEPLVWRRVRHGEQLRPTIYEFRPDNDSLIMLTKISLRHTRSVTTNASGPRATAFRSALLRRHQTCIVTQSPIQQTLFASHLIPRRLGDAGVQSASQRFTGSPTIVDRYDPLIGVPLFATLGILADGYELGFWNNGPVSFLMFHEFSH